MTIKEKAVAVVNEMVENGFHLVGETAEEFAERYGWNVEFLTGILEMVKQW